MELKAGYKQTEVGVIPEDWYEEAIGKVTEISVGRDLIEDRFSEITDSKFKFPVFSNTVSNRGLYGYYSLPEYEGESVTVVGRGVGLGTAFDRTGGYGAIGRLLVLFPNRGRVNAKYLSTYINCKVTIFVETGGIPQLTGIQFAKYKVVLPSLKEQEAIAEALSDADALIESLDQLITKKRHLKQGAMQELLTGKRRLPGFSGEWEVKSLSDVSWFQEGPGVRTWQFTSSGIKLLNGTNIVCGRLNLDSTSRFISMAEANGAYSHFLAEEGDIVIASSGITMDKFHEKVAIVMPSDLPFCMNTSTIRFKPREGLLATAFLFHFLTGDSFNRAIGGHATGSAQLNFGPSHIEKVEVSLPEYAEQTAIATILSDMDTELAELESRLSKARQIKQGMMQELLTGRIRLL